MYGHHKLRTPPQASMAAAHTFHDDAQQDFLLSGALLSSLTLPSLLAAASVARTW